MRTLELSSEEDRMYVQYWQPAIQTRRQHAYVNKDVDVKGEERLLA